MPPSLSRALAVLAEGGIAPALVPIVAIGGGAALLGAVSILLAIGGGR